MFFSYSFFFFLWLMLRVTATGRTLHHTVAIDLLRLPPCERDGGLLDKAMGDAVQSLLTELEASRRESIQQTCATR